MNQETTSISDSISSRVTKTMVWVSHDMTETDISFSINCPLPEEDFKTLDMLGKVHRELVPSRVEKSIYCEI
jgi:hypothetical protein